MLSISQSAPWLVITILTLGDAVSSITWQNEVNVSVCNWSQLRANIIRDTIYLDGGSLWWQIGLSDGTYGSPQNGNGNGATMYNFSLTHPFDGQTNLTSLLQAMAKNGGTSTANVNPNYVDGVMFANDDEFILYGGLSRLSNSEQPPPSDVILGYEADEYGTSILHWEPGFIQKSLNNGITRYVTNGAGVSAPSENLGFYFSGMRREDWGSIEDGDQSANVTADSLITVNMTTMRVESWQNDTLPSNLTGRANAELVWLPVSESGVLVAIGGVVNPEILTITQNLTQAQAQESNQTSPGFMKQLPVYDVSSRTWYSQNTTGDIPPQLTLFCSVVAAAADNSSFNIYIYGGYDGVNAAGTPSDDVYILSVPSFTWIKAYSGQSAHGRSGHKCVKVYPDQMFVIGGTFKNNPLICLDGGFVQVFNLNTLQFQGSYSPETWSNYHVPSVVTAQIGGSTGGGATKTSPTSWNNNALAGIFSKQYTKPIQSYYPYILETNLPGNGTSPNTTGSSHMPAWVSAIIGIFVGLGCICIGVIAWILYKRRLRQNQRISRSDSGLLTVRSDPETSSPTDTSGHRTYTSSVISPMTGGSSERPGSEKELESNTTTLSPTSPETTMSQADSSPIFELDSPHKKWVELPADCDVARPPSSLRRSHQPQHLHIPATPDAPGGPLSPSRSIQTTPVAMRRRASSHCITDRVPEAPPPPPGHSRRNTLTSVSISDLTESDVQQSSPGTLSALPSGVVQYYDPRPQRNTIHSDEKIP